MPGTRQMLFDKTVSAPTGECSGGGGREAGLGRQVQLSCGCAGTGRQSRGGTQRQRQVHKAYGSHSQAGLAVLPEAGRPHSR